VMWTRACPVMRGRSVACTGPTCGRRLCVRGGTGSGWRRRGSLRSLWRGGCRDGSARLVSGSCASPDGTCEPCRVPNEVHGGGGEDGCPGELGGQVGAVECGDGPDRGQ